MTLRQILFRHKSAHTRFKKKKKNLYHEVSLVSMFLHVTENVLLANSSLFELDLMSLLMRCDDGPMSSHNGGMSVVGKTGASHSTDPLVAIIWEIIDWHLQVKTKQKMNKRTNKSKKKGHFRTSPYICCA